ncbi:hypothetical protein D3C71_1062980 [compost metagenome]
MSHANVTEFEFLVTTLTFVGALRVLLGVVKEVVAAFPTPPLFTPATANVYAVLGLKPFTI